MQCSESTESSESVESLDSVDSADSLDSVDSFDPLCFVVSALMKNQVSHTPAGISDEYHLRVCDLDEESCLRFREQLSFELARRLNPQLVEISGDVQDEARESSYCPT